MASWCWTWAPARAGQEWDQASVCLAPAVLTPTGPLLPFPLSRCSWRIGGSSHFTEEKTEVREADDLVQVLLTLGKHITCVPDPGQKTDLWKGPCPASLCDPVIPEVLITCSRQAPPMAWYLTAPCRVDDLLFPEGKLEFP